MLMEITIIAEIQMATRESFFLIFDEFLIFTLLFISSKISNSETSMAPGVLLGRTKLEYVTFLNVILALFPGIYCILFIFIHKLFFSELYGNKPNRNLNNQPMNPRQFSGLEDINAIFEKYKKMFGTC